MFITHHSKPVINSSKDNNESELSPKQLIKIKKKIKFKFHVVNHNKIQDKKNDKIIRKNNTDENNQMSCDDNSNNNSNIINGEENISDINNNNNSNTPKKKHRIIKNKKIVNILREDGI